MPMDSGLCKTDNQNLRDCPYTLYCIFGIRTLFLCANSYSFLFPPEVKISLNQLWISFIYNFHCLSVCFLSLSIASPILARICQHCSLSRSMFVPLHCSILASSEYYYTRCKIYTVYYRPLAPVINSHFIPSATATAFHAG